MTGEFTRIRQFLSAFDLSPSPVGPGDDCAVFTPSKGAQLCFTVDAVVEGVHFTRATSAPADIGHKALAVNLSDLASMGAMPRFGLCALTLPEQFGRAELAGLSRGMAALARSSGLELIGGNVSRAPQLSVTITVAGEVASGKALRRDGAKAGDRLYVGGTLGDAAAGLWLLQQPMRRLPRGARALLTAQRRPVPQLGLGRLAVGHARACIDLSDGLVADAAHLAEASGLSAVLEEESLPLSEPLRQAIRSGAVPGCAADWALSGGEDYRLLLAVPPKRAAAFEKAASEAGTPIHPVGRLEPGQGVRVLDARGRPRKVKAGFDHFASG